MPLKVPQRVVGQANAERDVSCRGGPCRRSLSLSEIMSSVKRNSCDMPFVAGEAGEQQRVVAQRRFQVQQTGCLFEGHAKESRKWIRMRALSGPFTKFATKGNRRASVLRASRAARFRQHGDARDAAVRTPIKRAPRRPVVLDAARALAWRGSQSDQDSPSSTFHSNSTLPPLAPSLPYSVNVVLYFSKLSDRLMSSVAALLSSTPSW